MTERLEVFVTSPWVPAEWIKAHGLEPRGAWFGETSQPVAVPEGACAFARQMAHLVEAQPHAAVIFTTACDQMRRAADAAAVKAGTRLFLFNLPATWQSSSARRLYHGELARLGKFLEALGGRAPTDDHLAAVIRDYEARRSTSREFIARTSARAGAEALAVFFDTGSVPAPNLHEIAAEPLLGRCRVSGSFLPKATASGVPVALVGGPLLPAQWPLFDAIESAGGSVVLNATEPGERCLLPPMPSLRRAAVPAAAAAMARQSGELSKCCRCGPAAAVPAARREELVALIADHYLDHAVDVFHRPNSRLYAWLGARLAERHVRGIVLWVHVGCDLWRTEAASLREAFGLPVLTLDAHEVHAGGLRDSNRLAAFIESLQGHPEPFVAPATKGCGYPRPSAVDSPLL